VTPPSDDELLRNCRHPNAEQLIQAARDAATKAYCPYSKFRVGAAVLAGGQIFDGCNIENASFGLTVCAERVAIFKAVAAGNKKIDLIAVACVDAADDAPMNALMPCGACRQVMAEFGDAELEVLVDRLGRFRLAEIFPDPFKLTG
jgi:cytidine deaminase